MAEQGFKSRLVWVRSMSLCHFARQLSDAAKSMERLVTDINWNGRHSKGGTNVSRGKKCDKSSWKVCLQIMEGLESIDCLVNHQEIGWFIHSFNILLFYNDITSITYWIFRKNSFGLNIQVKHSSELLRLKLLCNTLRAILLSL